MEKISACLMEDEIASIGVHGMGGVGKTTIVTHVHNQLLQNTSTFGHVYWVTVSKESSIHKLQDDIAKLIGLRLSEDGDEKKRAALLYKALQKTKNFVLILDNVWENYPPEEVGIPIGVEGGKLIITTRLKELCLGMGCKEIIKVEPLSVEEAWNLFNVTLGRYNQITPEEEEVARSIVEECAGLPLAIVATARSMRGVYDIRQWRNALNELKENIRGHTINMENKVFDILKFSYDCLGDENLQECLLYCSLFPEDYNIRRLDLITYWIVEGLVEEMETRQAEFDRGHAILNKLENACLLESTEKGKYVKMHDVVRDMALNISIKKSRFMVKAGIRLKELVNEREWKENLERVSLMNNQFLSLMMSSPTCPRLCTLLLPNNYSLHQIPHPFFAGMQSLRVLDLSSTGIVSLSDSISDLVNLRALFLSRCRRLKNLPSLAKLQDLRELDLHRSGVEGVPAGMEKLVNLKSLDLSGTPIEDISLSGMLPNLSRLQCLSLDGNKNIDVQVESLMGLRQLEILGVNFRSLHKFNRYHQWQKLTHYHLQLKRELWCPQVIYCRQVWVSEHNLRRGGEGQLVLPTNVQQLEIVECHLPASLLDASPSLKNAPDLERCKMYNCKGIEYLWSTSSLPRSLKTLTLYYLSDLRVLFKHIRVGNFSSLKQLSVGECQRLTYMFTPELANNYLQNLQIIHVYLCSQMKDIIRSEEEKEEGEEEGGDGILIFPNLRSLELGNLPRLERIWKGKLVCDSLQEIRVVKCPMLRRLPFYVQLNADDSQTRPSTLILKTIHGEKEWWDLLEWDKNPQDRSLFQSLFVEETGSHYMNWGRATEIWEQDLKHHYEQV